MNDHYGLGLTETPGSVKVFKDFFIKLSVPFEVKRNEVVTLNILLFSFLSSSKNITLSVTRNDAEFSALDPERSINGWKRKNFSFPLQNIK